MSDFLEEWGLLMSYLPDLNLPSVLDSSTADLVADFYRPAMASAVQYDRGVGYFSSGWLRLVAQGMNQFAANGGRARILTSPILDEADWQALQTGDAARTDPILYAALTKSIADLAQHLEADTRSALAWMVADGILTFKLALPQNKLAGGDFHDKIGIFTDVEGNQLAFNGSPNESIQGTVNSESLTLFPSWKEAALRPYIQGIIAYFERLWQNQNANVRVFDLPEAAREQILKLRVGARPYPEPEWVKLQRIKEGTITYQTARPHIPPQITLRPYQEEARFFGNSCG